MFWIENSPITVLVTECASSSRVGELGEAFDGKSFDRDLSLAPKPEKNDSDPLPFGEPEVGFVSVATDMARYEVWWRTLMVGKWALRGTRYAVESICIKRRLNGTRSIALPERFCTTSAESNVRHPMNWPQSCLRDSGHPLFRSHDPHKNLHSSWRPRQ